MDDCLGVVLAARSVEEGEEVVLVAEHRFRHVLGAAGLALLLGDVHQILRPSGLGTFSLLLGLVVVLRRLNAASHLALLHVPHLMQDLATDR